MASASITSPERGSQKTPSKKGEFFVDLMTPEGPDLQEIEMMRAKKAGKLIKVCVGWKDAIKHSTSPTKKSAPAAKKGKSQDEQSGKGKALQASAAVSKGKKKSAAAVAGDIPSKSIAAKNPVKDREIQEEDCELVPGYEPSKGNESGEEEDEDSEGGRAQSSGRTQSTAGDDGEDEDITIEDSSSDEEGGADDGDSNNNNGSGGDANNNGEDEEEDEDEDDDEEDEEEEEEESQRMVDAEERRASIPPSAISNRGRPQDGKKPKISMKDQTQTEIFSEDEIEEPDYAR